MNNENYAKNQLKYANLHIILKKEANNKRLPDKVNLSKQIDIRVNILTLLKNEFKIWILFHRLT